MELLEWQVDFGGIGNLYLQKYYEELCERYHDETQKQIVCYPLYDEWVNLTNKETLELMNEYFSQYFNDGEEVTLDERLLRDFAENFFNNKIKEHQEVKQNTGLTKRREAELRYLPNYVYDKKTDTLIECSYGSHYEAIRTILAKAFNTSKNRLYWDYQNECDEYIAKNIILKGQYNNKNHYMMSYMRY